MSLETFFNAWSDLLRGETDAAGVEAVLGPSPSGTEAVAWCQRLYHHHREVTLRQLFPHVAALVDTARWTALVADYARAHPATGSEQRRWGHAFPAFLAAYPHVPDAPALADLAILAEARRTARFAADDLARVVTVALHHDAPTAERAIRAGEPRVPAPRPTLLVVYRAWNGEDVRELPLDAPKLVALLRWRGDPVPAPLREVPTEDATILLRSRGVLPPGDREVKTRR